MKILLTTLNAKYMHTAYRFNIYTAIVKMHSKILLFKNIRSTSV